jgi:hypothetical protein
VPSKTRSRSLAPPAPLLRGAAYRSQSDVEESGVPGLQSRNKVGVLRSSCVRSSAKGSVRGSRWSSAYIPRNSRPSRSWIARESPGGAAFPLRLSSACSRARRSSITPTHKEVSLSPAMIAVKLVPT